MTEFEDEMLRLLNEILELLKAQRGAGIKKMDEICNDVLIEQANPELTMDDILDGNYKLS